MTMNTKEIESIRSLLGITTPIQKLLSSIKDQQGSLFHVSGGSNSGKSAFSKLLMEELAIVGKKCAFFDIENGGWHHLYLKHGKINTFNSKNKNPKTETFYPNNKEDFYNQIQSCILKGYDCIVIDYINLLIVDDISSFQEIPAFLKKVAKENNIFIVAAINSRKSTSEFLKECEDKSDYFAILSKDKNMDLCLSFSKSTQNKEESSYIIPVIK
jgi:archaellum biogenesis ATPase FlaH